METKPGPLFNWPWRWMGGCKYMIMAPFLAKAVHAHYYGSHDADSWSFHMVLLAFLRLVQGHVWMSVSRWPQLTQAFKIQRKGINFDQVDRERYWDDYIILQALVITAIHKWLPRSGGLPVVHWGGMLLTLLLHVGPVELLYYVGHRCIHGSSLFASYHSHHHASITTEPSTATVHTFAESLAFALLFSLPIVGTWLVGGASIAMLYAYWMAVDFLNCLGHCNFEFVPVWLLRTFPALKYLVHTPSYHSVHHAKARSNFCLFMPIYDHMGGTVDATVDAVHKQARKGFHEEPDFVFLGHGVNFQCTFHLPFVLPYLCIHPFEAHWLTFIAMVCCLPIYFVCWCLCPVIHVGRKYLRGFKLDTWVVPRFGLNYFIPFESTSINRMIEGAILEADRRGVKVLALGALNKNESLNGGGKLFLQRNPDLKVRLVHGNTLTAAIILRELPDDVAEIFLTGSTSKLGRAISIYLALKGVRVLMLTPSSERFEAIRAELPEEKRHLLVQVTKYSEASQCKSWVIGKSMNFWEQYHAPAGTHFHQFVVPPVDEIRRDCSYGKLAAMRLPNDIENMYSAELALPRQHVYACHAGGLVHMMEGWNYHEVGMIDVTRIDPTWDAAMRLGFRPMQ